MTFRPPVFSISVAVLACFALFCGNFVCAQIVHAYKKPSEADLQWLRGDEVVFVPDSSGILQVGFTSRSNTMLVPRGPCSPVNVPIPMPSVPPPLQTDINKMNAGLIPEIDGVVNIAPIANSDTSVVQMSGERLPPPSELPHEENLVVPVADFATDPPPLPNSRERSWEFTDLDFATGCGGFDVGCGNNTYGTCVCSTCITCGDHRSSKIYFSTPDMFGGNTWFTGYNVGTGTNTLAMPTMLLTRANVAEHFNADVQNRIWVDYRHWNDAVSFNGNSSAVEQFSFGLERRFLQRNSVELRVPLIHQFASLGQPMDMSTELGNISLFLKRVLRQNSRWTISGGVGTTLPTAEDWRDNGGARLKNKAYDFVGFFGAQWHPNNKTFGHFVVQTDMPIAKNELVVGGTSQKVSGQQIMRTGVQLGRWLYRIDQDNRSCRLGAFAEVNYAVAIDGSPGVTNGTYHVSPLNSGKSMLTTAVGVPMVFGKLTCTNSFIMPISEGNRPFSVGYSISLTRLF